MKKPIYIFLIILLMNSCTYDYHYPNLYVDFKFQIEMENFYRTLVADYGYIPAQWIDGDSYDVIFYNDQDEIISTYSDGLNFNNNGTIFTAPKEAVYFDILMGCYGKLNNYSNTILICMFTIRQSLEEYHLWGVDNLPPYVFHYNINNISQIKYFEPKQISFYINLFPTMDKINAVEKYGYEILSNDTYFYTTTDENQILSIGKIMDGNGMYSIEDNEKIGIYCDCYGRKELWDNVLVCRIYSSLVSTEWLHENSSESNPYQFEIERIEYFVDQNYSLYLKGFSVIEKIEIVESLGYTIADSKSFLYEGNWDGTRVQFFDDDIYYSTDKEQVGLMTECYGFKGWDKILVCKIYSDLISSEWLSENSSKSNPYQFKIERIEYFVDHPD